MASNYLYNEQENREKPIIKVILAFVIRYEMDHTRVNYKRYLRKYYEALEIRTLGDIDNLPFSKIRDMSANYVEKFQAATTRNFVRSIVKSFWDYLIKEYGYPKNPATNLKLEPLRKDKKYISYDDVGKKLENLYVFRKNSRRNFLACLICHTLVETTLSISEVLQITVDMAKKGRIEISQKRLKRVIEIQLSSRLEKLMKEYILKYNISGDLFAATDGCTINRTNACRLLKSITGVSPNDFRKSVLLNYEGTTGHTKFKIK